VSGEIWEIDVDELRDALAQLDEFEAKQLEEHGSSPTAPLREGIRDGLILAFRAVEGARVQ